MSPNEEAVRRQLSVAMIVRNAADVLRPTLESALALADEVVVLDAGSDDDSPQVAEAMGAVVIHDAARAAEWTDDFSAARNACAARVSGDWVLWLDAGETLAPETIQQLRRFVEEKADPQFGYLLNIALPPETENVAGEQVARLRLVPRKPELQFTGRVREDLLLAVAQTGMQVERLPWRIERSPDYHVPEKKVGRAQRNLRLAKLELEQHGDQPEMLLTAGEALSALGKKSKAAEFFRRAIELAHPGSTTMLEAYYGLLTSFDGNDQARETQLAACLEALEIYPLDVQLLCGMGSYMLAQNRPDLAVRSYRIAVQHGQIDPQTWHLPDIAEVALACLSLTYQLLGQETEALQVLEDGLATYPESQRLRRQVLQAYIRRGECELALAQADQLVVEPHEREMMRSAVRGAALAAGKNWVAARSYLETAYRAGCRDMICLRWLSVVYLSLGELPAARAILDDWQTLAPRSSELASYRKALTRAEAEPPTGAAGSAEIASTTPRLRVDESPAKPGELPTWNVLPSDAPTQS